MQKKWAVKKIHFNKTPEQIFSLFHKEKMAAFLDTSLLQDGHRYSIIALRPWLQLSSQEGQVYINGKKSTATLWQVLHNIIHTAHPVEPLPGLPLSSGALGYFSYEFGLRQANIPVILPQHYKIPEALLVFYDLFLIYDHQTGYSTCIANGQTESATSLLNKLEVEITSSTPNTTHVTKHDDTTPSCHFDLSRTAYIQAAKQLIRHMQAGDIYVANLTQQIHVSSALNPYSFFQKLRQYTPAPYSAYFNADSFQIISSSMEEFLRVKGQIAETKPIKGTRPRSQHPSTDACLYQELLHSPKEQSELLMVTDMERNDLNLVCCPGSVIANPRFSVDSYAALHQMSSTIKGILKPECKIPDILKAMFPGGSITGAPRQRAMELINKVEYSQRGFYTGIMGYISMSGNCEFNILIRSALHQNAVYHIGAGSGLTVESNPSAEYDECLQKAAPLLQILGVYNANKIR